MINIDHNPVQTEEGVWTDTFKGCEFLVAHVSSMDFQNKLARLQQPYAKQIEKKKLKPEIQKQIMCKAMAGTILKDWRGNLVDKDNNPVKFTEALGERLLMNDVEAREFITEFASDLDHYREEETEDLGKP